MKKLAAVIGLLSGLTIAPSAQQSQSDGPRMTNALELSRPSEYREWVFLASGLGMTYEPSTAATGTRPQNFTNVFVNPASYRAFMQTGTWPDKTALVLEIRGSASEASINAAGHFQTPQVRGMEVHVKDARLPGGWGFFNFRDGATVARPLEGDQVKRCVECHTQHAAVDTTFVQFYPTLIDVARAHGSMK
jgi:hypothetical protein